MSQTVKAMPKQVTLERVNQKLLERLNELLNNASPEEILDITEAIAKLNSSYKGNSQFGEPENEDERLAREQKDVLMEVLKEKPANDVVEGEIV